MNKENKSFDIFVLYGKNNKLIQQTNTDPASGMKPTDYYSVILKAEDTINQKTGRKSPGDSKLRGRAILNNQESVMFKLISDCIAKEEMTESEVTVIVNGESVTKKAVLLKSIEDLGIWGKEQVPAHYIKDANGNIRKSKVREDGKWIEKDAITTTLIFFVPATENYDILREKAMSRLNFVEQNAEPDTAEE